MSADRALIRIIARRVEAISVAREGLAEPLRLMKQTGTEEQVQMLESLIEQLDDLDAPGGAGNYFR